MYTPRVQSELQQGKRNFEQGYYRRAMSDLLPLACDGVPEAQYAVGYMYYYGYGVAQDTEVGYFWIKRSADQHYAPAVQALNVIEQEKKQDAEKPAQYRHLKKTYRDYL
jgi:TPR repeat protein